MDRPFDKHLMKWMQETTKSLVKEVEGCSFGYTQSDEISLLLTDYKTIDTQPYFDYKLQKLASIVASMTAGFFNRLFLYDNQYSDRMAFFDARAFNIPKDEVVNYFIWRMNDATRNSIQMVAQSLYSHKQLHGKSCDELQEMIFQKGTNWNDLEPSKKRGTGVYKSFYRGVGDGIDPYYRTEIVIDNNTPIFTQTRDYIQKWVDVNED
jgi:tRNA(His) 5'-end guanylyltransferase